MKKILSLILISLMLALTACSGGQASATFIKPWVQESTDSTDQTAVYQISRRNSENVVIASGELTYSIAISKSEGKTHYVLTTDYEVRYNEKAGEFSGKKDSYFSELIFDGASTSLMVPVSLKKTVTFETTPGLSFTAEVDYTNGLDLNYTYKSEEKNQYYKAKTVNNGLYFDNEQLLLLIRSRPDWSAACTFKTVSISDCVYSGKLGVYNMTASISSELESVLIDTGLTHSILESGDVISCNKAVISLVDGETKGPSIQAYYAGKTKSDSKYYRLLIKYVQIEKDLAGNTTYSTEYTLSDVD